MHTTSIESFPDTDLVKVVACPLHYRVTSVVVPNELADMGRGCGRMCCNNNQMTDAEEENLTSDCVLMELKLKTNSEKKHFDFNI